MRTTTSKSQATSAVVKGVRDGLYRARHEASQLLRKLDDLIDQAEGSACEDGDSNLVDQFVQRPQYDEGGAP